MSEETIVIKANDNNDNIEGEEEYTEEDYEEARRNSVYLPMGELDIEIDIFDSGEPLNADLKILGTIVREYIESELRNRHCEVSIEVDNHPKGTSMIREIDASPQLVKRINEALGIEDGALWFRQYDFDDIVVYFACSFLEFGIHFNIFKPDGHGASKNKNTAKSPDETS